MACSKEAMNFKKVTDELFNIFGDFVCHEAISSIVDSCDGDPNRAANAIMMMANVGTHFDENASQAIPTSRIRPESTNHAQTKKTCSKNKNTIRKNCGIETNNAASTSKKKEIVVKQPEKSSQGVSKLDNNRKLDNCTWTEQLNRIATYHNQGARTLIIMRGAPGSGKSYLASQIQEMTVGSSPQNAHIFAADDFFYVDGYYRFDKRKLDYVHYWNQRRACEALQKGVSPVIIDNTNTEVWQIQPYVETGVFYGYLIEVVEPKTPWARNLRQLCVRNIHGVPESTMKRILDSLDVSVTSASLLRTLKLVYPPGINPPVLRSVPKYSPCSENNCSTEKAVSTLQEKNTEIQVSKVDVEDNEYCPPISQNIMHSHSKDELSQFKQIKYILEEEGDGIKELKDTELNSDETITTGQIDLMKSPITEDENIFLKSELIEQGGTKNEVTSNIDDKVEENNFHDLQNITSPPEPIGNKEDQVIMQKETELNTSKCYKTREDEANNEKFIEEFQKVENDWEYGEPWEEDTKTNIAEQPTKHLNTDVYAKSPRTRRIKESEISLQTSNDENDWRKIYTPMTSFKDNNNLSPKAFKDVVVMKSSETSMEFGDLDTSGIKNGYKVLSAIARDINQNYEPNLPETIPENRKFDKSSMTNELPLMSGGHRCQNENKHFRRFRNMFKKLKKEDLRDIFDKCCGDVNWAVNIVMDAMPNKHECIAQDEESDVEDETDVSCECTSFYGIIPDITHTNIEEEHNSDIPSSSAISTETLNPVRKQKKDSYLSDSSLALKRQIEQNIVISDQHYSEHSLKIRKMRRGELDGDVSTSQNIAIGITMQEPNQSNTFSVHNLDTTGITKQNPDQSETLPIHDLNSKKIDNEMQKISEPSSEDVDSDCSSDDEYIFNEVKKTHNIYIGYRLLKEVDRLFGRGDMTYSDNIEPRINIPMFILNEINTLWVESFMSQFEAELKKQEEMIKKDEEFARQLAMEQEALIVSGKEKNIPDLKEIMDMEYALSVYRKDCELLMQKERPTDMASKLSSKKLYDLFPHIPQDDLDEILMAHGYDFNTTVEVLLDTQGRTDITQKKNGISQFIMSQELERQEKFLAAEKKKLLEEGFEEIPEISLRTVSEYHDKAKSHLANWNKNVQKAKHMMINNRAAAGFYNNIAGLYLMQYEHAKSIATATLVEVNARNAKNFHMLDLHNLRLNDAMAAVDAFLDFHINRLRSGNVYADVVFIVTGRGLHSKRGPVIKPAARDLLIRRELQFVYMNPGLVKVSLTSTSKMKDECS